MSDTITIKITDDLSGLRLDKALSELLPDMSRSRLQSLIAQGALTCNHKPVSNASQKVKSGQIYTLNVPAPAPSHMPAQKMDLDIIHEDADIIVLNKPAGLTVHPAPGHRDGTLVNALLAHCGDSLSGIGGVSRPGIVHRLDKDTSGLMVIAKHDQAHAHLSEQLASHEVKRTYDAVCWGAATPLEGTITGNIGRAPHNRQKMAVVKSGGKEATTHYKTNRSFQPRDFNAAFASHVTCNLETGRTHQIRVHLTHIGHPLIGDPTYGPTTTARLRQNTHKKMSQDLRDLLAHFSRQALHARALELRHPRTDETMHFTCPLPDDISTLIDALQQSEK